MPTSDSDREFIAQTLRDLAHDIKQPVRGIRNYTDFLTEDYADKLDDKGRDMLGTLQRLSRQIERYVSSMVDASLDSGDNVELEDVDVNEVVDSVQQMLEIEIRTLNVRIDISEQFPTITSNRALITRIFLNLVSNGIQYNDSEIPTIEIGWSSDESDAAMIEFYVRDNGIGVDEAELESIFNPQVRLEKAGLYGAGLGLGLTSTQVSAEKLGGRIWMESELGEGSTVRFSISKR